MASVDCVLGDWTTLGACSAACGGGERVRSALVVVPTAYGGAPCGPLYEVVGCNSDECAASEDPVARDCDGCWPGTQGRCISPLTVCYSYFPGTEMCPGSTTECGGGTYPSSIASMTVWPPKLMLVCTCFLCTSGPVPVDCVVGAWNSWGTCSAACGGGTQVRTRMVETPRDNGGASCGDLVQERACGTESCGAWVRCRSAGACWELTAGSLVCVCVQTQ